MDDHRLKPIHVALHGAVSYESIRIVLAGKRNRQKLLLALSLLDVLENPGT